MGNIGIATDCSPSLVSGHHNDDGLLPGSAILHRPGQSRHGLGGVEIQVFSNSSLQAHCDALRCSEAYKCLAPGSAQLETPRRDCYHMCSRGEHWRQRCRGRGRPLPKLGCYESVLPTEPAEMNIPVPGFPEALFSWMRLLFEGKPGSPTKIPNPVVVDGMG
jgi:hypothetical protein